MNRSADSQLALGVAVISIAALSGLLWLVYGHQPGEKSSQWDFLPVMNASCNAITTFFLVLGVWQIKNQRRLAHEACMKSAFLSSSVFLLGYLTYHYFHGDTHFLGHGWIRPVYFTLLISHILLSILALPLVLLTFGLAWRKSFENHKRLAKWTFPIWLYVSLTGVAVFFCLRHFQPG